MKKEVKENTSVFFFPSIIIQFGFTVGGIFTILNLWGMPSPTVRNHCHRMYTNHSAFFHSRVD